MREKVFAYIRKNRLIQEDDNIVVGLSGGADSVSLFYILREYKKMVQFNLYAVHINHNIRGEEALRDEKYVEKICEEENVPLFIFSCDVTGIAKKNRLSVEEAGRIIRYEKFREVLNAHGGGKIAVAHHMNDQAETIMFNMIRGSGIKGIGGMNTANGDIIRPLLCVKRAEIEEYLSSIGREYCTDSTNLHDDYMRNRLRLKLIPYIEENINANFVENINEMAQILRETDDFMADCTDKIYGDSLIEKEDKKVILDTKILRNAHSAIVKRVIRKSFLEAGMGLKDVTKTHTEDVAALITKTTGKSVMLPLGYRAVNEYERLIIAKESIKEKTAIGKVVPIDIDLTGYNVNTMSTKEIKIAHTDIVTSGLNANTMPTKEIKTAHTDTITSGSNTNAMLTEDKAIIYNEPYTQTVIKLWLEEWNNNQKISSNDYTKMFDYDRISGNLQIRARQSGDYLIIDKSGKKKTLKAYYIDEKIPRDKRDTTLVIAQGNSVLWVLGHRISEKYKISADTKTVLCISIMEDLENG